MNYIVHERDEDFGKSLLIMSQDGYSFGRCYFYNDDPETIYFADISVNVEQRKKGYGNEILDILEMLGGQMGYKKFCLCVKKNTWMQEWYRRRKYLNMKSANKKSFVWMIKFNIERR